ncbi:hypothetical protein ACTXT7_010500 [Hymenolepis weldensis]
MDVPQTPSHGKKTAPGTSLGSNFAWKLHPLPDQRIHYLTVLMYCKSIPIREADGVVETRFDKKSR